MDVILLERIEKLGQMGDIVSVKAGYARNYLLPQKKALSATEANKARFEEQRAQLETADLDHKKEAEAVAAKMDGLTVVLVRQAGEAGQLYGSANARDIASTVTEAGFTVTRQQIRLEHPIKAIGLHEIQVRLHPEVTVSVTTNVARSEEEAEIQRKTGRALISVDEEEEAKAMEPEAAIEAAAETKAAADNESDPSGEAPDDGEAAADSESDQSGEAPDDGEAAAETAPEAQPDA